MQYPVCDICKGRGTVIVPVAYEDATGAVQEDHDELTCYGCNGSGVMMSDQDHHAWDDDEQDMEQIAREWAAYDRDPPGS